MTDQCAASISKDCYGTEIVIEACAKCGERMALCRHHAVDDINWYNRWAAGHECAGPEQSLRDDVSLGGEAPDKPIIGIAVPICIMAVRFEGEATPRRVWVMRPSNEQSGVRMILEQQDGGFCSLSDEQSSTILGLIQSKYGALL